jgi:GAF domain
MTDGGPVLDEATFQKLLAAAYVVQEHNERLRGSPAVRQDGPENIPVDSDSAAALAQIVDAQHKIHTGNLDLTAAMNLIVDRIRKITGAPGAAICLLKQDGAAYPAASGLLAAQGGSTLRPEAALSSSALLHDTLVRSADTSNDVRVNPEIARGLSVRSLIAVPVFHDGKTAGALELVSSKINAFQEHDVRTCQLMAGLVTEALTRAAQEEWRKGVAAERASMLEVLERIKPQLARLAHETHEDPPPALESATLRPQLETRPASRCKQCGNELALDEMFCGSCGTPRDAVARNDLQSKWATLWNLKQKSDPLMAHASQPGAAVPPQADSAQSLDSPSEPEDLPAESSSSEHVPVTVLPDLSDGTTTSLNRDTIPPASATTPQTPVGEMTPLSANAPERRVWLRSIAVSPPAVQLKGFWKKNQGFIRKHPGDLALGAAAILFAITIFWAVSSDSPTTSADSGNPGPNASASAPAKPRKKQAPPAPKLSMFDQILVSLGLAEPPPPETDMGNPNVPVWVDIHTGLYYCPGTDLYGKTQQGKIASQHDAQLDQFEPASRKVCD